MAKVDSLGRAVHTHVVARTEDAYQTDRGGKFAHGLAWIGLDWIGFGWLLSEKRRGLGKGTGVSLSYPGMELTHACATIM